MMDTVRAALEATRSPQASFPRARLRVTPAVHQELAYHLCEQEPALHPLGIVITNLAGIRVEIDADTPDPGWIIDRPAVASPPAGG